MPLSFWLYNNANKCCAAIRPLRGQLSEYPTALPQLST